MFITFPKVKISTGLSLTLLVKGAALVVLQLYLYSGIFCFDSNESLIIVCGVVFDFRKSLTFSMIWHHYNSADAVLTKCILNK